MPAKHRTMYERIMRTLERVEARVNVLQLEIAHLRRLNIQSHS